jgi:hypothetical protein
MAVLRLGTCLWGHPTWCKNTAQRNKGSLFHQTFLPLSHACPLLALYSLISRTLPFFFSRAASVTPHRASWLGPPSFCLAPACAFMRVHVCVCICACVCVCACVCACAYASACIRVWCVCQESTTIDVHLGQQQFYTNKAYQHSTQQKLMTSEQDCFFTQSVQRPRKQQKHGTISRFCACGKSGSLGVLVLSLGVGARFVATDVRRRRNFWLLVTMLA